MTRPVFIKGKKIDLVTLSKADAEACFKWLNDLEIILDLGPEPLPVGLKQQEEYLADLYSRKNQLVLGIQRKEDGALIGTGGLSSIEWVNQRAELTICIGEKDQQGKGYGGEATSLILNHAFRKLNLHSVMLRVIAYNKQGIRCYEKCGFKLIGARREAKVIDNQYFDVLYMDILADEFVKAQNSTQ